MWLYPNEKKTCCVVLNYLSPKLSESVLIQCLASLLKFNVDWFYMLYRFLWGILRQKKMVPAASTKASEGADAPVSI
jgi:hypothetical protein